MKSQDVVPSIQLEEADGSDAFSSGQEDRVDTHKNAPMTPVGRLRMVQAVEAGESMRAVAYQCRTDPKSVRKWVQRYRTEGEAGLRDRSSRPHRSPRAIARATAQRVITLRRRRWTMAHIAAQLRISRATVSRVLARAGLSRLAALEPAPLPCRYEGPGRASCCTSTARSWHASSEPGTASRARSCARRRLRSGIRGDR